MLVDGPAIDAPPDPVVAAFGRIVLPPGEVVSLAEADGPLLLHVEAGRLVLDTHKAEVDADGRECAGIAATGRLVPGEAAVVPAGSTAALRAEDGEPLVVFAVAILSGPAALEGDAA